MTTLPHFSYEPDIEKEWLVTNGIGGYAASSLTLANTRRYHGLLVAALEPPLSRTVLLSKLDEQIVIAGKTHTLAINQWRGGAIDKDGLAYLTKIEFNGTIPTFHYNIGQVTLTKTIWLERGLNTVYVRYAYLANHNNQPLELEVRPFANERDYHKLTSGDLNRPFEIKPLAADSWQVQSKLNWYLQTFERPVQWQWEADSGWWVGFYYEQEAKRGFQTNYEDLYCLGTFTTTLTAGQSVTFAASTEPPQTTTKLYAQSYDRETTRQSALIPISPVGGIYNPDLRLILAADQFIVGRPHPTKLAELDPDYRTILAGYHWFSDWGRDTMISLPGLTLATNRKSEALLILRSFAKFVDKGMLPNRFPDDASQPQESDYNTVDATLWYFEAIRRCADPTLEAELYPILKDIIQWHIKGTRFGIKLDTDGLLMAGTPTTQLTWMDVKIGDWAVTPRNGKPVEIQALWYAACRYMADLAQKYDTQSQHGYYTNLANQTKAIFEQAFWYDEGGYLYDYLDQAGQPNKALRPNGLIALALAPDLLEPAKRERMLKIVQTELLTPYGLRTLAPTDPAYKPHYTGNVEERDAAYHQGTVWTWLLLAYARLSQDNDLLKPFQEHLNQACIGQVNEIFGAEPPYPPVGCVAQAWSVAALLEIMANKQ